MKNAYYFIFLVIILGMGIIVLFFQNQGLSGRIKQLEANTKKDSIPSGNHEEEYPLAQTMHFLQLYHNKLYYAGQNNNWKLASFYLHEIEESMEEIIDKKVVYENVKLFVLMEEWGIGPLEKLEEAVVEKNAEKFAVEFDNLIINCNGCHVAAKHSEIKIQKPTHPVFTNQVY